MITITGEPKEIAALVAALQERQCKKELGLDANFQGSGGHSNYAVSVSDS